jgi:hypothetical protein
MITKKVVTLTLPEELVNKSKDYARKKYWSYSTLVQLSLEKFLGDENQTTTVK